MAAGYDSVENIIGDLPSMPTVVAKILNLLENDSMPNLMIADAVAHDPALTARILGLANSASSGVRTKVKNLDHAIGVVGRRNVRTFALESSVKGMNSQLGEMGKLLWENSVGCAIGCRLIARTLNIMSMDEAFVAGLFYPVGKVVLALRNGYNYQQLLQSAPSSDRPLRQLELDRFGLSHEVIGAALLEKWNLDRSLVQGILHCLDLKNDEDDQHAFLISKIVNVAVAFVEKLGIGCNAPRESIVIEQIFAAHLLRLTPDRTTALFEEFRESFQKDQEYYLV